MATDLVGAVDVILRRRGFEPTQIEPLMGGEWSTAFGFVDDGRALVVRCAADGTDHANDAFAVRFASPALPIPAVLDRWETEPNPAGLGPAISVSERVPGTALEEVSAATWADLVPSVADVLEALRTSAPVTNTDTDAVTWGPWAAHGARPTSWVAHLRGVGDYPWQRRTDWRSDAPPAAVGAFDAARAIIERLDLAAVPRSIVHADLIHRNVHVVGYRIAGVFDWGCAAFGDHLYDLAWFEFWAPWHPNVDVELLQRELRTRWAAAGIDPLATSDRYHACLAHIGADHIVYNVIYGTATDRDATIERLRELGLGPRIGSATRPGRPSPR